MRASAEQRRPAFDQSTSSERGRSRDATGRKVARLSAMSAALARNWWLIALRGAFAILFGIVALIPQKDAGQRRAAAAGF
jgi:hypothetical protein